MDKRQLIDDIRKYNPTAKPRFLAGFNEPALQSYLEHLQEVLDNKVTPAVRTRRLPKAQIVRIKVNPRA